MFSRAGGDATDSQNFTANNICLQGLALAGPSATESFGPEPGGDVIYVAIFCHDRHRGTFKLRCGLFADGGAA